LKDQENWKHSKFSTQNSIVYIGKLGGLSIEEIGEDNFGDAKIFKIISFMSLPYDLTKNQLFNASKLFVFYAKTTP